MEEKKTKKRHNATVTFSRKEQKEEMLQYLNSVQLQNIMPDDVKGKDCLKVLWAVEYLHRLAVDGNIRVQVPMFEEDSQEKQGLLDEYKRAMTELAHDVDSFGYGVGFGVYDLYEKHYGVRP